MSYFTPYSLFNYDFLIIKYVDTPLRGLTYKLPTIERIVTVIFTSTYNCWGL